MNQPHPVIACIGLRARTARAIVVVVSGSGHSQRAASRAEITLGTPGTPSLFQPYHEVLGLPWDDAVVAVQAAERSIAATATSRLKALLPDLSARGLEVASVAIVGAPDRDLTTIGSPHVRAHAAEGVLFTRVWQVAARAAGLSSTVFSEKGIELLAANRLHLSAGALGARLVEFGHALGRPWRADEKAAAMAACVALATRGAA